MRYLAFIISFVCVTTASAASVPDSLLAIANKGNDSIKVVVYNQIGNYYQNKETNKSFDYFEKALALSKKIKNRFLIARSIYNIGNVYCGMGEYPKAINYLTQSLTEFEAIDNKRGMSQATNSMGNAYAGQDNYTKAEEYYNMAMQYAKDAKDDMMIAISSYGVANILNEKKKYPESIKAFENAAVLFKKLKMDFEYAAVRVTQADIWQAMEKIPEAKKSLEEAIPIMEKTGDKYGTSQALKELADIYTQEKEYNKALPVIYKAMAMCREIDARANVQELYKRLAYIYNATGDKANAYEFMEKYALLNDSLFNEQNAKATAEFQEKYQSVKKEKELLKQQEETKKEKALARQSAAQIKYYLIGALLMAVLAAFAFVAYRNNKKANKEITLQKAIIEEKNKDITDSIRYAHQIQQALLPLMDKVRATMGELFVYYEPKDIVSGDFYWVGHKNNKMYIAAADCTGHGVPGAFMSMLGFYALDSALKNESVQTPADLLHHLHHTIIDTFRKKDRTTSVQDGMDITICSFDTVTRQIEIAAANNRAYIMQKDGLMEIKGDLFSIGSAEESRSFINQSHIVSKGDVIYLFSDGYASQFGGDSGKKMKYSRMKELLQKYSHLGMHEQQTALQQELEDWKGGLEQIDDILVMGIRIS